MFTSNVIHMPTYSCMPNSCLSHDSPYAMTTMHKSLLHLFVSFFTNISKRVHLFILICRILKMMHTVSLRSSENRMTPSAVAACMAPLLLRPLLAGECEMEDDYDMNGDSSAQLLAAANAANNAQAIITTLLEEYENIFDVSCSTSGS